MNIEKKAFTLAAKIAAVEHKGDRPIDVMLDAAVLISLEAYVAKRRSAYSPEEGYGLIKVALEDRFYRPEIWRERWGRMFDENPFLAWEAATFEHHH